MGTYWDMNGGLMGYATNCIHFGCVSQNQVSAILDNCDKEDEPVDGQLGSLLLNVAAGMFARHVPVPGATTPLGCPYSTLRDQLRHYFIGTDPNSQLYRTYHCCLNIIILFWIIAD